MHKTIIILVLLIATFGCRKSNEKELNLDRIPNYSTGKEKWYDTLVKTYISNSDNELIMYSRKDTTIKIEWILDRVENTDSSKYLVFHIGHDIMDEGNINKRFVTDTWLYIDSLTKKVYEYDLPNDSLSLWKK